MTPMFSRRDVSGFGVHGAGIYIYPLPGNIGNMNTNPVNTRHGGCVPRVFGVAQIRKHRKHRKHTDADKARFGKGVRR